jgi:hypothetical protein
VIRRVLVWILLAIVFVAVVVGLALLTGVQEMVPPFPPD